MTEQIWANDLRFYRETSPGSGTPVGQVFTIPAGPTAVATRTEVWGGRLDAFRNPKPLTALHRYHEGKASFSIGAKFLAWLLSAHMTPSGGRWLLTRSAPTPTFSLEVQTGSDAFRFVGIAIQDIQIGAVPPELTSLDLAFQALAREPIESLRSATSDLYSEAITANRCKLAYVEAQAGWGTAALLQTFSCQLFMTRRKLAPAQFMPDGRPDRFVSDPWRVMADMNLNRSELTIAAKDRALGRLAFYVDNQLEFRGETVSIFSNSDPVKALDFREENLIAEFHPDADGSIFSIRDIPGTLLD